jgi:nitrogen fixation protein NifU and related proteins
MSNLDDLYREIILDHYRSPRNRGELASPPAHRVEGFNPLCGDEVVVYLDVQDGVLNDIKLTGHGCSISQSSSSLMSAAVKGKSLDDVRSTIATFKHLMTVTPESSADENKSEGELRTLGELAALAGVARFPVRIKCATLAWNTLAQGLQEIA